MGDEEDRTPVCRLEDVADQTLRSGRIEVRCRLVEHEDWGICQQSTGQRDPLTLTARQLPALLSDERIQAVRERRDPVLEPRAAERGVELRLRCLRPREEDVLANRRREEMGVLSGDGESASDVLLP